MELHDYLIKSTLTISFLYLFYLAFLNRETYFSWNRLYLLTSLIIALIVPILKIPLKNSIPVNFSYITEPIIINELNNQVNTLKTNHISILSIIYISGAVFFMLKFLSSLAKINYLYFRFPKIRHKGFKAVLLDGEGSPFTFFNILFIAKKDYIEGKLDELIIHEQAHREQFHSVDIVLVEIMKVIQWFNPFVWLFSRAIKSQHEFIADNKVINKGYDALNYQKMLFEKSLGITFIGATNNFNYSLLKKRLKMMTTKKSGKLVKIKYLISVPILLMAFMLLSMNNNSFAQKEKVYKTAEVMPKHGNVQAPQYVRKFIAQNIKYPELAKEKGVTAKIYVQFVINKKGGVEEIAIKRSDITDNTGKEIVVVGYSSVENAGTYADAVKDLEKEAERVVGLLGGFTPGQKDGKNIDTQWTFPIVFALQKN